MKFLKRSLEKRESTFDDIRALERRVNILIVIVVLQTIFYAVK